MKAYTIQGLSLEVAWMTEKISVKLNCHCGLSLHHRTTLSNDIRNIIRMLDMAHKLIALFKTHFIGRCSIIRAIEPIHDITRRRSRLS